MRSEDRVADEVSSEKGSTSILQLHRKDTELIILEIALQNPFARCTRAYQPSGFAKEKKREDNGSTVLYVENMYNIVQP